MRIGLTGATGFAGYPIASTLSAAGHDVITFGRRPTPMSLIHRDWRLGDVPDPTGLDAIVHAAFSHVTGRYRGGEGDDPEGFLRQNRDGSLRLLETVGSRPVVFLSSRAVYGPYPPGTKLGEEMRPMPETLYGQMKLDVEEAVVAVGGVVVRPTGLYGFPPPGRDHKWRDLFADFAAGRKIDPRVATEVHADDVAGAIRVILEDWPVAHQIYNISDLVLDRRDLLAEYGRMAGIDAPLPARADPSPLNEMVTDRLRGLAWRPRGWPGLIETLAAIVGGQTSFTKMSP